MQQQFPTWVSQPGSCIFTFAIDGSAVGATPGTTGLDGRGKFLGLISKSTNRVTITWNSAFGDLPYVWFEPDTGQNDTIVQIVTKTVGQLVFDTVKASDNSAVNDADLQVLIVGYNTTSYVS